jgi:hypothetical protein
MHALLDENESQNEFAPKPPKPATVLTFVAAFAIIVSWIGVYAVTNALISTDTMAPFPQGQDPRPRWMLQSFGAIFATFSVFAVYFQWSSGRQMRQIDQMADAEDKFAD